MQQLDSAIKDLEDAGPNPKILKGDRLEAFISVAAAIFSRFLVIHPFLNGNGHIGRVILAALADRYGYNLWAFPVEPGLDGDLKGTYNQALMEYQSRPPRRQLLEELLVQHFEPD